MRESGLRAPLFDEIADGLRACRARRRGERPARIWQPFRQAEDAVDPGPGEGQQVVAIGTLQRGRHGRIVAVQHRLGDDAERGARRVLIDEA